jgi:hypothetical protein
MIAWHVPEPAGEGSGNHLAVQGVFGLQAGVGDVAAVQYQVRTELGDGAVDLSQPLRQFWP